MEGISGENKSYSNIEHIDPRLIREELNLTRIIENPIGENDQNQVKDIPFCLEEEPLKMEFPCFNSTRKDIECSFSTELNQQKALPPEDKSSGEGYNNFNIEKEINSKFENLKSIGDNSINEFIKDTIYSPNSLDKCLSELEYENEAGLLCKLEIKEEDEDEKKFILTEEEYPWEGYTNWQPLRNANLVDSNNNNPRNNYQCANQHVKLLENISKPKKNK
ncbi:hypothetical protein O181_099023 [Austropuccinia psidii MF-1]|uniref:Uncharacterized protein n=1 Tax=Austropuccinia psidii MF-1 TaxID=1389203 RepID=A0A9Q3PER2_9BASI|nr:hypothetical protein [Austropuccinia psidii MF-1]